MNRLLRVCFLCTALGWALSSGVLAVTKDAPYEFIVGRNVFKLQTLAAPIPPVQPPASKPVPKVVITGITDICGRRQMLAEIYEPGRPTINPVLAEGEEAGQVQVLRIEVGRGVVIVRINGEECMLALHSPSVPIAPPPVRH